MRDCPSCRTAMPAEAVFCSKCGAPLPKVGPQVPPEQAAGLAALQVAVGDKYRVTKLLGQGGMALVYEAEDPRHQRRVAIKVLKPDLSSNVGAERFLREIETAAKLNHPNILAIHDSGNANGVLYYVMPMVEGESLGDRLAREKRLPADEAIRLAREVAEGLQYAHSRGVVHRDMKPDNVLLQAGHALIADFGIAMALGGGNGPALTGVGFTVGTPHYMSPEQALGEANIDGRTDIYAVGTMLYEMLAGRRPFDGGSPQSLLARNVTTNPPKLDVEGLGLPAVLGKVVEKAMAQSPDARHRDAAALVDALTLVDMNMLTEGVRSALATPVSLPAIPTAVPAAPASPLPAITAGVATAAALWAIQAILVEAGLPSWAGILVAAGLGGGAWAWHRQQGPSGQA